jgi:hypothetical protein
LEHVVLRAHAAANVHNQIVYISKVVLRMPHEARESTLSSLQLDPLPADWYCHTKNGSVFVVSRWHTLHQTLCMYMHMQWTDLPSHVAMLLRLEGANEGNPKTEISNREIFSSYSAVAGWQR